MKFCSIYMLSIYSARHFWLMEIPQFFEMQETPLEIFVSGDRGGVLLHERGGEDNHEGAATVAGIPTGLRRRTQGHLRLRGFRVVSRQGRALSVNRRDFNFYV